MTRLDPSPHMGLTYVVWELTLRCDLACRHCGSRAGRPRANELTRDEALDVVRQLADMGAAEVTLIGGEAYLHDAWTDVIAAIRAAGMSCTMTTGGRGMTPERARAARDAGVDSVSVSLDGLAPAHDLQRGLDGSFAAALAALDNLRAAGVPVSANSQINRLSVPDLPAVLELIADRGCFAWQVALTVPMGRAAERPEWLLQPWELVEVFPLLASLATRGAERGVTMWPGNNVGYFGPFESVLRGARRPDTLVPGCTAGTHLLGIESDGSIKGCPSLPSASWVAGNVRERPIRELWEHARELRYTRDRTVDDLWGYCRECYYADACRAGCTWTSHVFFGRPGNNPYCHHRALERARHGLRERLVRVEPAPGEPFDHGRWELVEEPCEPVAVAHRPPPRARRLPVVR